MIRSPSPPGSNDCLHMLRLARLPFAVVAVVAALPLLLGTSVLACSSSPEVANPEPLTTPDVDELAWLDESGPPTGTRDGEAEHLLEEAQEYPLSYLELQDLADEAFFQRDFATAEELYRRALEYGMTDPEAMTRLGVCVMGDDPAAATRFFLLALDHDVALWEAHFYLASCYYRLGRVGDLFSDFQYDRRSRQHERTVQEGALSRFQHLIRMKGDLNLPIHPAVLYNRALCLYVATQSGRVAREDFIRYHEMVGPHGPHAERALRWIQYFEQELALEASQRYTPSHSPATSH